MKICKKCGVEKTLCEFHRHNKSKDGHRSVCKDCRVIEGQERYTRRKMEASNSCVGCGVGVSPGKDRCPKCKHHEGHPQWKGGRHRDSSGYIYISGHHEHPNANKNGTIAEHRLVMTHILGRSLLPGEEVHHKNGIRDDNRPENLELWTKSQPSGQRVSDLVAWAKEILELYPEFQ